MAPSIVHPTTKQVVIVDVALDDYYRLIGASANGAIRLTTSSTGAGGLRLAPSYPDALWLLSLRLPDMSGFDLLGMLHSLQRGLKAVLVDNQYNPQREQRALELQALQYVCKPVHMSWLNACQSSLVVAHHLNSRTHCTQNQSPGIELLQRKTPSP